MAVYLYLQVYVKAGNVPPLFKMIKMITQITTLMVNLFTNSINDFKICVCTTSIVNVCTYNVNSQRVYVQHQ